jgi:four helix bundle protein
MGYRSFEELEVWKKSCRLAVRIYELLKDCRDFGLKDQMTRAAVSIPSNIAEGSERNSKQEYIRFIHIAKGSAAELRTQLYIAAEIGLMEKATVVELTSELKHISAMLQKAANTIKQRLKQQP